MNTKISMTQAVILLFTSRAFSILNFIPAFNPQIEPTALFIGYILGSILELILLIPIIMLFKKSPNIIDIAYTKYKYIGKLVVIIYLIVSIIICIGNIVGFQYFLVNAVYPNSSSIIIIITFLIACFYAASLGIEGLARACTIIFILLLISVVFITFASIPYMDFINIKPIFNSPIKSIIDATLLTLCKTSELLLLIFIAPFIKGDIKKGTITYLISTTILFEVILFVTTCVLGEYVNKQSFPYYTLTSIVEFSIFQRLDSIHMILWVCLCFIRVTSFIFISKIFVTKLIHKKPNIYSNSVLFAIIAGISIFGSYNITAFKIDSPYIGAFIAIILICIIPSFLLITKRSNK